MSASLVGSEMCIRDRDRGGHQGGHQAPHAGQAYLGVGLQQEPGPRDQEAVSYTHLTLPTICSV
eukprot:5226518-Alexandrium_andersonii.AAC.1